MQCEVEMSDVRKTESSGLLLVAERPAEKKKVPPENSRSALSAPCWLLPCFQIHKFSTCYCQTPCSCYRNWKDSAKEPCQLMVNDSPVLSGAAACHVLLRL